MLPIDEIFAETTWFNSNKISFKHSVTVNNNNNFIQLNTFSVISSNFCLAEKLAKGCPKVHQFPFKGSKLEHITVHYNS